MRTASVRRWRTFGRRFITCLYSSPDRYGLTAGVGYSRWPGKAFMLILAVWRWTLYLRFEPTPLRLTGFDEYPMD